MPTSFRENQGLNLDPTLLNNWIQILNFILNLSDHYNCVRLVPVSRVIITTICPRSPTYIISCYIKWVQDLLDRQYPRPVTPSEADPTFQKNLIQILNFILNLSDHYECVKLVLVSRVTNNTICPRSLTYIVSCYIKWVLDLLDRQYPLCMHLCEVQIPSL